MSLFDNPVQAAIQALQDYGSIAPPPADQPYLPYLEHQSYDPSYPNYKPEPYESSTSGEIEMPEDHVGHDPGVAPSVPQRRFVEDPAFLAQEQLGNPKNAALGRAFREKAGLDPDSPTVVPQPGAVERRAPLGTAAAEGEALDDYGRATLNASRAQQASDADTQDRVAQAYGQSYQDQARSDQEFQTARSMAHQAADAQTHAWLQEYTQKAQEEPNPHRWFENKSSVGKALWLISLAAGAINQGWNGGMAPGGGQLHNVALEMAQREIQDDINAQKLRLDKELGALKLKGQTLDVKNQRVLTDLADDHTRALGRLNALEQEYLARAKAPGKLQNAAADAQVTQWFAQQKMGLATRYRQEAVQARESELARAQQMRLAQMTDSRDRAIAAAQIQKDYDLAKLQSSTAGDVEKAKAQAEARKDLRAASPQQTGFVLVGPDGKPVGDGVVRVHKEDFEKFTNLGTNASQAYSDMGLIEQSLKDDSFADLMARQDPRLLQAINRLGYATAKADDPGGRVTDVDFSNAVKQRLGYDPSTGVFNPMVASQNKGAMLKAIADERKQIAQRTQNAASAYFDQDVGGAGSRILWSPKPVRAPEAPEPNARESLGQGAYAPPKDLDELHQRQEQAKAQPEFARQLLPDDPAKVTEAKAAFSGHGPAFIDAKATQMLDHWGQGQDLDPTTRLEVEDAAHQAHEKAAKALEDFETGLGVEFSQGQFLHAMHSGGQKSHIDRVEADRLAKKEYGLFLTPEELTQAIKVAESFH